MSKQQVDYVINLGGSLVNPGEFNAPFLQEFQKFIVEYVQQGKRLALIIGGGRPARMYQGFLRSLKQGSNDDLDLVGIRATMLNAEFMRVILKKYAYPYVLETPDAPLEEGNEFGVFVFSGWKNGPGHTTDYTAVFIAKRFGLKSVISLSNIKGVYTMHKGRIQRGNVIARLSWQQYEGMIGGKYAPGMKVPFDPPAAKEAKQEGMSMAMLYGEDLDNVRDYLEGRKFRGTVIK
jgi:uridylate kinase